MIKIVAMHQIVCRQNDGAINFLEMLCWVDHSTPFRQGILRK